jgi:uncharacterized membrane protein YcaP (DUF421 family)
MRMNVVNSFYGALLGIWMVRTFFDFMTKSWWVFLVLSFIGLTIYLLNRAVGSSKNDRTRFLHFGAALPLSFLSSFIIQLSTEPTISMITFIAAPKTWIFLYIVIAWFFTDEFVK